MLGLIKPVWNEVHVYNPEIYPETPIVGRPGIRLPYLKYFGLHYQILEEKIVVTVMPSVKLYISNAELIKELKKNLERIRLIMQA